MNSRKYEAMVIVKPAIGDGDVQKLADRYKGVIESKGGSVSKAGKWEKRKLAYEIEGFKEGTYILMNFESAADVPQELSRQLGNNDDVIRHRIFKLEG
ncbi:MAG: 30S ribosomal protein S6 [Fimbriimonadaceae bacterium]|nr:30S ribosomal protein S6 [Fimbriimonadaceae bacterium]